MIKETNTDEHSSAAKRIPLVGTVTAGVPILAEENIITTCPSLPSILILLSIIF